MCLLYIFVFIISSAVFAFTCKMKQMNLGCNWVGGRSSGVALAHAFLKQPFVVARAAYLSFRAISTFKIEFLRFYSNTEKYINIMVRHFRAAATPCFAMAARWCNWSFDFADLLFIFSHWISDFILQASKFWGRGSDSEEESEDEVTSAEEETSSEDGSSSSESGSDSSSGSGSSSDESGDGKKRGASRWVWTTKIDHFLICFLCFAFIYTKCSIDGRCPLTLCCLYFIIFQIFAWVVWFRVGGWAASGALCKGQCDWGTVVHLQWY